MLDQLNRTRPETNGWSTVLLHQGIERNLVFRSLLLRVCCLGLVGLSVVLRPDLASATTGPTHFLPKSHYKVANKQELPYVGQYILRSAAKPAKLSGGALGMEIDNQGYLYGVGQFYGYDVHGFQSSWTATLYNFRFGRNHEMIIDLLGPTGKPLLGRLLLSRAKSGDLSGKIQLGKSKYQIKWHKISKL